MAQTGQEIKNKGFIYEARIKSILTTEKLFTPALAADCKHTQNDAGFIYKGKSFFLELKNATAPDYGAKKIIYSPIANRWKWNEVDDMSNLFDRLGILSKAKAFIPRKHTKPDKSLTKKDKEFDRKSFAMRIFEKDLEITDLGLSGASILHQYYAKKKCYYIQIEGKGFYYLSEDKAKLGVPQFIPSVAFRLRAKTHSSSNIANYSFRVVLTASRRSFIDSEFDLENPTKFPPI